MTGDLILGDNVRLEIGSASGGDLQIYHDGGESYIKDAGTGALYVASNEFKVTNAGISENMIVATEDGSVEIYHNNVKKFETASGGVTITGVMASTTMTGTVATATQNSITTATGLVSVGALDSGSITSGFGAIDNGASNIRTGGHVHLDVDADADDITGDSATGRISLGAGEDLNLYHGGTNSYIVNGTGNLIINSYASDSDIIFSGNDAGDPITALTFDMSDAGVAKFNRGILFHNDTAAANELDDYEEGTWTPSLQVAPSGVSIQSGSVVANYTKIGNRVCISMVMNLASSNNPGSNTDMRIAGFPFANADSSVTHPANLHANHKPTPQLHINGNGYLYYQNTTEGGNNQNPIGLGLDAVSVLGLSFQYRTTS